MVKLRTVFFDIDNTLFPTDEFAKLARKRAVKAMVAAGLKASEAQAYSTLIKLVRKYGANDQHHFDRLLKEFGMQRNPRIIAAGVIAYHGAKERLAPYPDTIPTLHTLHRKGLKLYALTRGVDVKQWDKLIRLGLQDLFDGVFVTCKKNKAFYSCVQRKLHLRPGEAAMVGDNPRIDVIPANSVGLVTIHLMKGKHAKDEGSSQATFRIRSLRELAKIFQKLR